MFQKTVSTLFRLATVVFLIGGLAIVTGQAIGLILGDGALVIAISAALAPYAYGSAGIAGLLAFVMSYTGGSPDQAVDDDACARAPVHES